MLATLLDGSVLWANPAFEELTQYTISEFTRGQRPITWPDITVDHGDLESDLAMAHAVVAGDRQEYQLTKQYRRKDGTPVNVIIHVLRFPLHGDFQCFLVSVYPIDHGAQFAIKELTEMRAEMMTIMERMERTDSDFARILKWADEHPRKAALIAAFLAWVTFGKQVFEFFDYWREVLAK